MTVGAVAVTEATWPVRSHTALVAHVATTIVPRGSLTASQAIAAIAVRHRVGRAWLEVGVGGATTREDLRLVGPADFWRELPRPAAVAGVEIALWRRLGIAFHVGVADHLHQASVELTWR